MKLGKLDKNGMDLYFTLGSEELRNECEVARFTDKMVKAAPQDSHDQGHTDMEAKIGHILSRSLSSARTWKKDVTLIVLTDGKWKSTTNPKIAVGNKLVGAVEEMDRLYAGHRTRPLTFQFVYFGDDKEAISRLEYLDDDLAQDRGIP